MREASSDLASRASLAGPDAHAATAAVLAAALFAVVIWAGTPIVTKIAVDVFDPLLIAMMRSVVAALVLVPVLAVRRVPLPQDAHGYCLLLASALGGFVAFPILFSLGLRFTTASHVALIQIALPIFTGIIGAIAERRWPGKFWVIGCTIALIGEVALIGFRFGVTTEGGILGDLLVLGAAVFAALGYVTGSHLSRRIGTWATTLWGNMLGGAMLLLPLVILTRDVKWAQVGFAVWGSVAYLAICSSVIGYIAWYWALARGGVARVGATQFAMPVMTLGLAALVLGEKITLPLVLSGVVILSGVWLTQRRPI